MSTGKSALEECSCLGEIAELAVELALDGVSETIALGSVIAGDGFKGIEGCGWPFDLAESYGAVDKDDGSRL